MAIAALACYVRLKGMCGRMLVLLLYAATRVFAAATCENCHKKQVQHYAANTMSRALYPIDQSIAGQGRYEYQLGRFRYTIDRGRYVVTDGQATIDVPLRYAFGQGFAGQTYAYELNARWYESRISYYKEIKALDLTMGAPPGEPKTLAEAAGREMTSKDVVECFACHTTNSIVAGKVTFDKIQPGVTCENCHGPAATHAARLTPMKKLSALTTEEQSDSCGRCHRTWADIATNGPRGIGNVRFQPYRLANSKCYDATDRRIACTACHDPHGALVKESKPYDPACLACHGAAKTAKARLCKAGQQEKCSSCHMPTYEIPGSHHLFTDHQIRVVRKNETYPN
jgi:nitrate/TMAO reductase-like tetraheme cytochrome c subunit